MSTMNISLPESMKTFIDSRVVQGGYGSGSEYVRTLIRKEQAREQLRRLVLAGVESGRSGPVDATYFDALRARIRAATAASATPAVKQAD
jgi:antitoxin ParD1/3/4